MLPLGTVTYLPVPQLNSPNTIVGRTLGKNINARIRRSHVDQAEGSHTYLAVASVHSYQNCRINHHGCKQLVLLLFCLSGSFHCFCCHIYAQC